MSPRDWLKLNWKVGALSFGGGGRAIYFHDALVQNSAELSDDEFQEGNTISQLVPGPNLVNLSTYLGMQLVGWRFMLVGFFLLCIPGAVIGIAFYELIDLNNPTMMLLFKGFSLGSVTFFLLFIYRLAKGLRSDIGRAVTASKLAVRILLAVLVAAASLYGFPLFWVLVVGIPVGVLVEFQT